MEIGQQATAQAQQTDPEKTLSADAIVKKMLVELDKRGLMPNKKSPGKKNSQSNAASSPSKKQQQAKGRKNDGKPTILPPLSKKSKAQQAKVRQQQKQQAKSKKGKVIECLKARGVDASAQRHDVHCAKDIKVPDWISDTLSAGAKYIQPRLANREFPIKAWPEFVNRIRAKIEALNQRWDPVNNRPFEKVQKEKYLPYQIPIIPREYGDVESVTIEGIEEGILEGWSELNRQVQLVPEQEGLEQPWMLKFGKTFEWLEENNILVKQTDKNLGTVLVSADWYKVQVMKFLETPSSEGVFLFHPVSETEAAKIIEKKLTLLKIIVSSVPVSQTPGLGKYLLSKSGIDSDTGIFD
ncbi:hypothetical protein FRC16_005459, partial [Serendipita sp. 398]